jgi:hypothetical protein
MNIFLNFVKTLNKKYVFKVGLSRFMETSKCHSQFYNPYVDYK